jgi:hypothetical protein
MRNNLDPGERVRIWASREIGSARLLDGLTGEIVGPHPVARGWYKINLDPNEITPYNNWSAPRDRLVRIERMEDPDYTADVSRQRHFP